MSAASADVIIDGQTLSDAEIQTSSVSVVDGAVTINITTNDGWTLAPNDGGGVTPDPDPDPDPDPQPDPDPTDRPSVNLSASTVTAEVGEVVTFSWTTSGADSCVTVFGNAAWRNVVVDPLAAGSVDITMTADLAGAETLFRLSCTNSVGTRNWGQRITVSSSQNTDTADCPNPEVSQGTIKDWSTFWGGTGFPLTETAQQQELLERNRYLAIRFNTSDVVGAGGIGTVAISDGLRNVSISECPGVFTKAPTDQNCASLHTSSSVQAFSTNGLYTCDLEPNKTYYVNVTYVDVNDFSDASSFCDQSACFFRINTTFQ